MCCFWYPKTLFPPLYSTFLSAFYCRLPLHSSLSPSDFSVVLVSVFGSNTNPCRADTPPLADFLVNHKVCMFVSVFLLLCVFLCLCCIDFAECGCTFSMSQGLQVLTFDRVDVWMLIDPNEPTCQSMELSLVSPPSLFCTQHDIYPRGGQLTN